MQDFDVHLFVGPQVIANLLSTFLAGVATVQVYMYYRSFPDDRWLLKAMVGLVWLVDIVHTFMTSAGFYEICVLYFGHPEKFMLAPNIAVSALFLSGSTYLLVQGFFSYRVWVVTQSQILAALCWALTLLRTGSVLALAGTAVRMDTLMDYSTRYRWLVILSFVATTVGDILTTISLSWALASQKDMLFKGMTLVVDRLILWTLETGALTSIVTTSLLICFLTMQRNWIWISILFIVPRVYTNSFLASLNGRKSLNEIRESESLQWTVRSSGPVTDAPAISIEMTTTRHASVNRDRESAAGMSKMMQFCSNASQDNFRAKGV